MTQHPKETEAFSQRHSLTPARSEILAETRIVLISKKNLPKETRTPDQYFYYHVTFYFPFIISFSSIVHSILFPFLCFSQP